MNKFYLLVVFLFSSLIFCTKNPAEVSEGSEYKDSIIIDLFSYNVRKFQLNPNYYSQVTVTAKGQALLKPLDPNLPTYNSGSTVSPLFVPKYVPSEFEAWSYDSLPLASCDSLDPELLLNIYSSSLSYLLRPDTALINPEKSIRPLQITYMYGLGFMLDNEKWGLGKIKIYYK